MVPALRCNPTFAKSCLIGTCFFNFANGVRGLLDYAEIAYPSCKGENGETIRKSPMSQPNIAVENVFFIKTRKLDIYSS